MSLTVTQQKQLDESIENLTFKVSEIQKQHISHYLACLLKWNKVYNLTGFKTFEENLKKNILDSLSIEPFVHTTINLDIGTGAGLPGLLLAIINSDQSWVLLDSNGKKTRFLQQMVHELALENVEVVNERLENFHRKKKFQGICSRAFDKIPSTLERAKHLLSEQSLFYAMKGRLEHEDLNGLPCWAKKEAVYPLRVPDLNEERHLLVIRCELTREN